MMQTKHDFKTCLKCTSSVRWQPCIECALESGTTATQVTYVRYCTGVFDRLINYR